MPYEIRWGPPPVLEGFTQFMLGRMGAKREAQKWEYEHRTPWGRIGGMGAGAAAGAGIGLALAPWTFGLSTLGTMGLGAAAGTLIGGEVGGAAFDEQTTAQSIQGLQGVGQTMADVGMRVYTQERGIQAQQQAATQQQAAMFSRMHLRDFGMTQEEMAGEMAREIQGGSVPASTTAPQYRRILAKRRLEMTGDEYIRRDRERHFLGATGGRMGYGQALEQNPDDPMAVLAPAMMEHQEQQRAVEMRGAQQAQQVERVQQAYASLPVGDPARDELIAAWNSRGAIQAGILPRGAGPQDRRALERQANQRVQAAGQKVLEAAEAQKMTVEKRQQQHELNRAEDRDDAGNLIGWTYYNQDGSFERVSHPAGLKREEEDKVIDIGNGVMMPETTYYKMIGDIAKLGVDYQKELARGATARFEKPLPYNPASEYLNAIFTLQNFAMERAREQAGPEIIAGPPEPGAPPQGMPPPGAAPPAPAGEAAPDWTAQAIEAIRAPLRQQLGAARTQGVVFNRAQAKTVMNQYYGLAKQELGEDAAPNEIKRRAQAMLTEDGGLPAVK